MELIDEFNKLISEYMLLHPDSINPTQYLYMVELEFMVEMLKNANGKEIVYIFDNFNVWDGGYIAYKEN
jgi:hypothetical protein